MPTVPPNVRNLPIGPNLVSDWSRARQNYASHLRSLGKTGSIMRPLTDTDGISTGQPGSTEVVPGLTGIPFIVYPWPGPNQPLKDSRLRARDFYVTSPVRISFIWGTPVKAGDQLAVEPLGTGLPVYVLDDVSTDDSEELDTIASGADQTVLYGRAG